MLAVSIWHVDAFAEQPFTGNAAAVCLLDEARDDAWMQSVAAELNLSETAFVVPRGTSGHDLRWFTPTVEVDLCGHATLAAAHVLWEAGRLAQDASARFHTRSGLLTAAREGRCIELDFPALPPEPAQASPDLLRALGAAPERSLRSRQDALLVLSSEEAVRALRPDFAALRRVALRARAVLVRGARPRVAARVPVLGARRVRPRAVARRARPARGPRGHRDPGRARGVTGYCTRNESR